MSGNRHFCLPQLVTEETEGTIEEVHDCADSHQSDDVRQKRLQEAKTATNHQKQKPLHKYDHIRPVETDSGCKRTRGITYD